MDFSVDFSVLKVWGKLLDWAVAPGPLNQPGVLVLSESGLVFFVWVFTRVAVKVRG